MVIRNALLLTFIEDLFQSQTPVLKVASVNVYMELLHGVVYMEVSVKPVCFVDVLESFTDSAQCKNANIVNFILAVP